MKSCNNILFNDFSHIFRVYPSWIYPLYITTDQIFTEVLQTILHLVQKGTLVPFSSRGRRVAFQSSQEHGKHLKQGLNKGTPGTSALPGNTKTMGWSQKLSDGNSKWIKKYFKQSLIKWWSSLPGNSGRIKGVIRRMCTPSTAVSLTTWKTPCFSCID